jgi:phage-related protein
VASTAEVDLVISTADTLPELERDLNAIIRTAEDGAPSIDVDASFEVQRTIAGLEGQLNAIIQAAEADADPVELQATMDRALSLNAINADLRAITQRAESGAEGINLQAELDEVASRLRLALGVAEVVADVEAAAPDIEVEVDIDRDGKGKQSLTGLTSALTKAVGPLAKVSGGILGAGVAASSAAPLLAGVATAVESIAPASALAVSGMLTLALVGGTVKLAMQGVGEAITTAFDPEAKPEELAKAMEKLAPNARAFVTELRSMKTEFKELQQDVQETFFQDFDTTLQELAKNVFPAVSTAVRATAVQLNQMALGAAEAAIQLGKDGTLGKALESSTAGLENLVGVPGRVVRGLGQIAAAAGPSFERVTAAAAESADKVSAKLSKAFESGALEEAISGAVDAIAQLGRIAGNVFGGLGNIIGTVSAQGGGLFATLEKITQAFEDATASDGFQLALKALLEVGSTLVSTVLPLISSALQQLGPVFQALSAPVQILVRALGEGIGKIFEALGPVLLTVANAFGQLVLVVAPFVTLAGNLIAAILPGLTPLFEGLGQALNALVPFAEALASTLTTALVPLFTKLATEVLPQLIPPFVELSTRILPVLTEIIIGLTPTLTKLATTFGELVIALTPVIVELINLTLVLVDKLLPILGPILDGILKLINLGFNFLASTVTGVIIPIINILVDLLRGDFSAAWQHLQELVRNVVGKIGDLSDAMGRKVEQVLIALGAAIKREAIKFVNDFINEFSKMGSRAADIAGRLPGIILGALGDLGNLLVSAGSDLVQGLINGISGKLGRLREIAGQVADTVSGSVKDLLGISSPSKVMMEVGNDTMDGFLLGIAEKIPDLRSELQGVAALAPSFALPGGQTLQLPQFNQAAQTIQVFIGNEQLNGHFDARIAENNMARDRLAITGVRR